MAHSDGLGGHEFIDGVCRRCGCSESACRHFRWTCSPREVVISPSRRAGTRAQAAPPTPTPTRPQTPAPATRDARLWLEINHLKQAIPELSIQCRGAAIESLLIPAFPLDASWNQATTRLLIEIPEGYPWTPPDRLFVDPDLSNRAGLLAGHIFNDSTWNPRWPEYARLSWHIPADDWQAPLCQRT